MAVFTVTNTNDSGAGSLRDALAQAEANGVEADQIVFDASLDGMEINLETELVITSGTVTINGDVDGDGNPDLIISGDSNNDGMADAGDTNLLTINAGATVNLNSVHLTEGYARGADGSVDGSDDGSNASAGITNSGTLTITDSIISDNQAQGGNGYSMPLSGGGNGGAASAGILNNTGAVLTINDTLFDNNIAIGGAGANGVYTGMSSDNGGDGGSAASGVANFGLFNSNNVLFNDGQAYAGDGGNGAYYLFDGGNGGDGGDATLGILNGNTGTLTGTNTGNYLGTATPGNGGNGGGSALGDPGTNGADGDGPLTAGTYTFLNQGGDISQFTDTGFGPFYGSVSNTIATAGDDVITGDASIVETIIGLAGDDTIDGGYNFFSAGDVIFGGAGNDTLSAGDNAMIYGGTGNDTITAAFYSSAFGGSGNDTIFAAYASTVMGEAGNDRLINFNGGNILDGGTGFDYAVFQGDIADNRFTGTDLTDLFISRGSLPGASIGVYNGTNITSIERLEFDNGIIAVNAGIFGDETNEIFNGNAQNNLFFGLDGNDTINGVNGNDALLGGNGTDILNGGAGDDFLDGGIGSDTLNGGTGDDTILGGFGNDIIDGDLGEDTVDYSGFGGNITVNLNNNGNPQTAGGGGVDVITNVENIIGGDFADRLTGLTGDSDINGGAGGDRIFGLGGNDMLFGEAANDLIQGGNGNDVIDGGTGQDQLNGGNGNDTILGGDSNELDRLTGAADDDILDGGGGRDILRGDSFNTSTGMNVTGGNDIFDFNEVTDSVAGGLRDIIRDFVQGEDMIDVSDIDAVTGDMDDTFTFIGRDSFSGTAGELRFQDAGRNVVVSADVDGDGAADLQIQLNGNFDLEASDFIL